MQDTIHEVVKALRESELAARVVVFGSLAKGAADPKDVDAVVDLRPRRVASHDPAELEGLLRIARRHYGWFDPFVRYEDALLVRNDTASSWTRAMSAQNLQEAMDAEGVCLVDLTMKPSAAAAPARRAPRP